MARDYVKNQRSSRPAPHRPESTGPSGMVYLLVGVLVGLIIAGVFYVKNQRPSLPTSTTQSNSLTPPATTMPQQKPNSQNNAASTQNLQTQFDFYNVLPSQKVVGPSGDEDTSNINTQNNSLNNPPASATPAVTQQPTAAQSQQSNSPPVAISPATTTTAAATPPSNNVSSTTVNKTVVSTPNPDASKSLEYILQIATLSQFNAADQLKAQLSLSGFEVNITPIQHDGKTLQRVWLGPFHSQDAAQTIQKQLQDSHISSKLLKSS
jgi:cell division protein FtsN